MMSPGCDVGAGQHFVALDRADAKAGEVIIARGVHAGHFGGFAADQRAAGLAAALGDRRDDRGGDGVVELSGRVIIEEEQRLGALDDEVVGAHRDEIDADAVVTAGVDRQLELGPDAVIGGDQQGIGVARRLEVEEAAESAELGVGAGPCGRAGERADRLHQRISGVDRHAGIGISQGLLAHSRSGPRRDKPLGFPRRCRQKAERMLAPPLRRPHSAAARRPWGFRRALRAARNRRPRHPAARQLGNARYRRHPRRRRRPPTRNRRAMPAGASPSARASARCGPRCTMRRSIRRRTFPTGRSTRSSARSMSSARRSARTAISPTSASCSTARAPRRSSELRAARSSARSRCC